MTALSPRRFQGRFTVRANGEYTVVATTKKEDDPGDLPHHAASPTSRRS